MPIRTVKFREYSPGMYVRIEKNGERARHDAEYVAYVSSSPEKQCEWGNTRMISQKHLDEVSEMVILDDIVPQEELDLFMNKPRLVAIRGLERIHIDKLETLDNMFMGCVSLRSITGAEHWKTSHIRSMSSTFNSCWKLEDISPLASWDTGNVGSFAGMMSGCSHVKSFEPLKSWDVSKGKSFFRMFSNCHGLGDLDAFSAWELYSANDIEYMFDTCANLTDISGTAGWDVSNIERMGGIFKSCCRLVNIDALRYWDVSSAARMSHMFEYCVELMDFSPIYGWDVSCRPDIDEFATKTKISTAFIDRTRFKTSKASLYDIALEILVYPPTTFGELLMAAELDEHYDDKNARDAAVDAYRSGVVIGDILA